MIRPTLFAAALGASLLLTACGGGGSSDDNGGSPAVVTKTSIAGPLDTVQRQLSNGVISPLASAVAGTPLEPVLVCTDAIATGDVLDIVDTVLVGLQSSVPNAGANPAALADSLRNMSANLVGILQALGGQASACAQNTLSLDQLQSALTALDGTPLAPLAQQLQPVLAQIIGTLGSQPGGSAPSLSMLSALGQQLQAALQTGIARLPAGTTNTPIVGGTLFTLQVAVGDVSSLLTAVAGQNPTAATTAVRTLTQNLLVNLTTRLVPLNLLGSPAGVSALTAQIQAAAQQFATALPTGTGQTQLQQLASLVLDPVQNQLLPLIVGPIMDALAHGSGGSGGVLAGTALAPAVNLVQQVLAGLAGSANGTNCVFFPVPVLALLCGP